MEGMPIMELDRPFAKGKALFGKVSEAAATAMANTMRPETSPCLSAGVV